MIIILMGTSCTHKNEVASLQTIHFDENQLNEITINDIFSNIEYVQLELNEDNPIGAVSHIEVVDDRLFLSDGVALFEYTTNGMYVNCLKRRGKGPQEYTNISNYAISDNHIYIIDKNAKLLKYDIDNHDCLATVKLDFYPSACYITNDNQLLITSAYQNEGDKFHLFNIDDLSYINSFQPINVSETKWRHYMAQQNFYIYDGKLLFFEPMNNQVSIVDTKNNEMRPYVELTFSNGNPPKELLTETYKSVFDFNMKVIEGGYKVGTYGYAETNNHILFSFYEGDKYYSMLYNKKSKKANSFQRIIFHNDIPSVHTAAIKYNFKSEKQQYLVIPEHIFFDENDKPYVDGFLSNNVSNGNPIIAIVELI